MYTIYCDFCGFYEESPTITNTYCSNCGHALIIENDADDKEVVEMIESEERHLPKEEHIEDSKYIENMKKSLKKLGHKRTWDIIEQFPNAYDRAYYRGMFKKAGGRK